jgi:two-component system response regulator GlrR
MHQDRSPRLRVLLPASRVEPIALSVATLEALALARTFADAQTPIVLAGATGTGKTYLAEQIHGFSGRSGEFTDFSVGEIDAGLALDQLFGHERGGFTGAVARRRGLFETAGNGTLLLDDFQNLALPEQRRLLRVLDRRVFGTVGGEGVIPLHCRVIVGMCRHPDILMAEGKLLPDLRYRFGQCVIVLPPLAERREEIAPFAERFLARCRVTTGCEGPTRIADEVIVRFEMADWRGNLRDLQGVVERGFLLARAAGSEEIGVEHLPDQLRVPLRYQHRGDRVRNHRLVACALRRTQGKVGAAAQLLGVHRNTIRPIVEELRRAGEVAGRSRGLRRAAVGEPPRVTAALQ